MARSFQEGAVLQETCTVNVLGLSQERTRDGTACLINIDRSLFPVRNAAVVSVEYDDLLDVAHIILGQGDDTCTVLSIDLDLERSTLLWRALNEGGVFVASAVEPELLVRLPLDTVGAYSPGDALRHHLRANRARLAQQSRH